MAKSTKEQRHVRNALQKAVDERYGTFCMVEYLTHHIQPGWYVTTPYGRRFRLGRTARSALEYVKALERIGEGSI